MNGVGEGASSTDEESSAVSSGSSDEEIKTCPSGTGPFSNTIKPICLSDVDLAKPNTNGWLTGWV